MTVINSPPAGHYRFFPESTTLSWLDWFSAWAVLGLGSIASQDIFQRVNSARSEKAAIVSTYIAAVMYLAIAMLPLFIILAASLLFPEIREGDPQALLPQAVLQYAPLWLQIIFFGSILSAVMSTSSGALLAPASILAENLIKPHFKAAQNDRTFLWLTRFSVLGIALVALIFANLRANIYELVAESSIFGLVSLFIPMTFALYRKNNRPSGAMMAIILGIVSWALFNYVWTIPVNSLIPGMIGSIAGMVIGNQERVARWLPWE